MKRNGFVAAAFVLVLFLASCSSSGKTSSKSSSTGSGITISGFAYSGTLTVKPGQKVTVTNKDSVPHTVTDKQNHKFDTGSIDGSGGTGTFTAPTTPGSYQFGCTFHPNMAGTLVVKG
jgi:plastocyanin